MLAQRNLLPRPKRLLFIELILFDWGALGDKRMRRARSEPAPR